MELLAFAHAAHAFEDPTPAPELRSLDELSLSIPSSSWMGLLGVLAFLSAVGSQSSAWAVVAYGDTGSEVAAVQRALNRFSYYSGPIDGIFGSGTERAVVNFQYGNSLSADGIVGPATEAALGISGSGSGGGSSGTSGVLRFGDTGSRVTALQTSLVNRGYNTGGIDGVYGSSTRNAVTNFQRNNGLSADGIAGPATLSALGGLGGSSGSGGGSSLLQFGDSGAAVNQLQSQLSRTGYYFGAIDSIYGSGTENAVYRYQVANGLQADGIAGPATLSALGLL